MIFRVLPLRKDVTAKLRRFGLMRKFEKQAEYLAVDPKHPSLNLELLEPKIRGIYSIRIDKKFRALLRFMPDKGSIEIIAITNHYH